MDNSNQPDSEEEINEKELWDQLTKAGFVDKWQLMLATTATLGETQQLEEDRKGYN